MSNVAVAATPSRIPAKCRFTLEEAQALMLSTKDENVWALCNSIVSLYTANAMVTSAAEFLEGDVAKHLATIENLRAEVADDARVIRELTARCEDLESREAIAQMRGSR